MTKMPANQLHAELSALMATYPDLTASPLSHETHQWLGRCHALLERAGLVGDAASFSTHTSFLGGSIASRGAHNIAALLHKVLAFAEAEAPAASRGSFISVGAAYDAVAAIGKVLGTAKRDVLIVDAYMDHNALSEFAALVEEGIVVLLLADKGGVKPGLAPIVRRWIVQHGERRPIEARLAENGRLHDRVVIVDRVDVWVVSQSLNGLATRSPATIIKVDPELAAMKIAAYRDIWESSDPIA